MAFCSWLVIRLFRNNGSYRRTRGITTAVPENGPEMTSDGRAIALAQWSVAASQSRFSMEILREVSDA